MSDFFPLSTKRPRDYAAEIAKLPTREERRAALEMVPPDMQPMVKTHVVNTLQLVQFWRRKMAANPRAWVPDCVKKMMGEY